jgi:hypothetical protein
MSFLAKLQFETGDLSMVGQISDLLDLGDDFDVLSADYEMTQPLNGQNKPSGLPQHGIINLIIESGKKTKPILQWMKAPDGKKAGKIIFYRSDNFSAMRTLQFYDAHCFHYREFFNSTNNKPMTLHLKISAGCIVVDNESFYHPWSSDKTADVGTLTAMVNSVADTVDDVKDDVDNVKDKTDGVSNAGSGAISYTKDTYHSGADLANDGYQAEQTSADVVEGKEDYSGIKTYNPFSDDYVDGSADKKTNDQQDKDDLKNDQADDKDDKSDGKGDSSSSTNNSKNTADNSSSNDQKISGPDPETPGLGGGNQDGSQNA